MTQNRRSGIPTTWCGWNDAFSSLDIPNYRWFWFSTTASFTAMQMQMVVRGWLVYEVNDSPLVLGIVSAPDVRQSNIKKVIGDVQSRS